MPFALNGTLFNFIRCHIAHAAQAVIRLFKVCLNTLKKQNYELKSYSFSTLIVKLFDNNKIENTNS